MTTNNLTPVLISGVSCYEHDGTAYLKLEDVARGLGFTEVAASGNECIRWRTVRKYLDVYKRQLKENDCTASNALENMLCKTEV